jgi:hypothetical protein
MPTVSNATLTISQSGTDATLRVKADVTFSKFELQLVELGLSYHTHVYAYGVDGGTLGPSITSVENAFGKVPFSIPKGQEVIHFDQERTVNRADLQEDPGGDDDEIQVKLLVHAQDLREYTPDAFTNVEKVLG